jgi:hypothetical protein
MKKISYFPNLLCITRVLSEENSENLEKDALHVMHNVFYIKIKNKLK